jgi:hypothetical protein
MVDVTSKNFHSLWPTIQNDITEANFVAFDAEFTGLHLNDTEHPRLEATGVCPK